MERRSSSILSSIPVLAFVIRVIWVYVSPAVPVSDWADYFRLAVSVAAGDGFVNEAGVTAFRPPGYSLLLSLPLIAFEASIKAGQLINVLLSTLTVFLTIEIARRIWNARVALFAGIMMVSAPSSILYAAVSATETLATTAMVAAVFFLLI